MQLAAQCPDAAFPVIQQTGFGAGSTVPRDVSNSAPEAIVASGLPAPYRVVEVKDNVSSIVTDSGGTPVKVLYRDGAETRVSVLSRVSGDGLLIPESTAGSLGVSAGDRVQIGDVSFLVAGVYRDLFTDDTVRPYWCSYTGLFLNAASGTAPPPLVLATTADVVELAGEQDQPYGMNRSWVSPIDTAHLTLTEATRIIEQRERAFGRSGIDNDSGGQGDTGLLPSMVERTALVADGLRGPVIPIAVGGSLLALLLVAAAGSYWADRRAGEVRLLSSRGVGPAALGGKAVLELALPAAAGTALGWMLARVLIAWLGPNPDLDAAAPGQAARTAAAGLVAALVLLGVVAGVRARGMAEQANRRRRSWAAVLPWELLLLAAAAVSYLRLRQAGAVIVTDSVAQVNLLLITFPLLLLAGSAILCTRLLTGLLPLLRQHSVRFAPALYLAIRRVSGARLVSAVLLVAVSLPIAVLGYSATLTGTSRTTLEAKARVVVGSDLALITTAQPPRTAATDAVGTFVHRYPRGTADGHDVTILAVDPATFARWAFWDNSFADLPLPQLLDQLGATPDGEVAAIAMGLPAGPATVQLGTREIGLQVLHTAQTLPGRRLPDPILLVDATSLGEVDRSAGRFTEIWSTRSETDVRAALPQDARIIRALDRDTVFSVANFLSVSWSFDYLQALAALIGAVSLGGLALYLQTRQRSRVAAYALARRMGLSARSHRRSLLAELGSLLGLAFALGTMLGWLAVLIVYRQVELDPTRPPGPLLRLPIDTMLAAAAATIAVTGLAALYAQRAADGADMAQVLRLGE